MLEISYFQWNYGYGIIENFAEVFWGVYSNENEIFEWHKAFSEDREVVENLPHASRPSTSVNDDNIEKVKKILLENHHVRFREVVEALNISYGSTQHIVVHVLGMKRVAARRRYTERNKSWLH